MLTSELVKNFKIDGELVNQQEIDTGHINNTFVVTVAEEDGLLEKYTFQVINTNVFKDPWSLMENTRMVTEHIREKLVKRNINPQRRVLEFIQAENGSYLYCDDEGKYWRAYRFVQNACSYDQTKDMFIIESAGKTFGRFQKYLADFPIEKLTETIPGFHDTRQRFGVFKEAFFKDSHNRAKGCMETIEKVLSREKFASYFMEMLDNQEIPLRVTHNDTKFNNVLIDNETHKGVCVIDLDTVMPGLSVFDFGDAIRFAANTAAEDEPDLNKVHLDMEVFDAFAKGFIGSVKESLTKTEIINMHFGAMMMTFEVGMRFLTDYLEGDVYFKTKYPEHNLVRARCQIKLFEEMWDRQEEMLASVMKHAN